MELFDRAGHLTDTALRALCAETLPELARLEAAEHLSFCDGCLERYTALLTDDTLLQPSQPLRAPVLRRIRQRAVSLLFNQYTTFVAAACLALVLWGAGVFNRPSALNTPFFSDSRPTAHTVESNIFYRADKALRQWNLSVQNSLADLAGQHGHTSNTKGAN